MWLATSEWWCCWGSVKAGVLTGVLGLVHCTLAIVLEAAAGWRPCCAKCYYLVQQQHCSTALAQGMRLTRNLQLLCADVCCAVERSSHAHQALSTVVCS
jgi:hypothetical protein